MTDPRQLILQILIDLVEQVADQPRRILFKGVSELSDEFTALAKTSNRDWQVRVTRENEDIVGARNDTSIATLVVFYRDEVRERESLNAFRQFDEDIIAEQLVQWAAAGQLTDTYSAEDVERLRSLLNLVYPSADRIATFLLAGRDNVGTALSYLGLFNDLGLRYDLPVRQWNARVSDNYQTAVLRWRDFLERSSRNREARRLMGSERLALVSAAETDPSKKPEILQWVTYQEALQVLNPPNRLVSNLMQAGMTREEAEQLSADVKGGRVDPHQLPQDTPALPEAVVTSLVNLAPNKEDDDEPAPEEKIHRVGFCLEGLLRFAGQQAPFPRHFFLGRDDTGDDIWLELAISDKGQLQVALDADLVRALSIPKSGASELLFKIAVPDEQQNSGKRVVFNFSLENLAGRLEPYSEIWPGESFWQQAKALDPPFSAVWEALEQQVHALREVVDPDWHKEQTDDAAMPEREPNNPIYLIFDLVYLANRDLIEDYLDRWLAAGTLPWRANINNNKRGWRDTVEGLLTLGLASGADDSVAVFPYFPLRLAWYRQVFTQVEAWLAESSTSKQPLIFEAGVMADQFQATDRPHVLFRGGKRLVEAYTAPLFSYFIPEAYHKRARAPLHRARQKLDQFGRMWPFSRTRLHLAFQPGDAGDDVYQLLARQADEDPNAAYRVQAVVDGPGVMTNFDRYLLSTGDDTTDLLTQEHFESLLPRIDYAKGRLDSEEDTNQSVAAHAAMLVDAFREERYGFGKTAGRLNPATHWISFVELARDLSAEHLTALKAVDITAPSYHTGEVQDGRRDLVYVPMSGNQPEYLFLLVDTLTAWVVNDDFGEGAYYELVHWDTDSLANLHNRADWVILFDRTLDKSLFTEKLAQSQVRLIDFYPSLPGGYRLSVSSRRTDAVEWQLVQVLQQYFGDSAMDLRQVARAMLDDLARFASGLLLKTLGGGSLTQELLGLYATYRSLIAENILDPTRDWLVPLDNYQNWFGRRTQKGRRADLLVLRNPTFERLEALAIESKWYKKSADRSFIDDEFRPDGGQLRTTVETLHSLFDPNQKRLDRDYWQRTLFALLDEAPSNWDTFRRAVAQDQWELVVDGRVYVHQYTHQDPAGLAQWEQELDEVIKNYVGQNYQDEFAFGPRFNRLRLLAYPELAQLFSTNGG